MNCHYMTVLKFLYIERMSGSPDFFLNGSCLVHLPKALYHALRIISARDGSIARQVNQQLLLPNAASGIN